MSASASASIAWASSLRPRAIAAAIAYASTAACWDSSNAAPPAACAFSRCDTAMSGAGTDKTKNWTEIAGPTIILVEPQLGENIGAAARVMANFGLARLRLVKPRDGWPNLHARRSASGADRILDDT